MTNEEAWIAVAKECPRKIMAVLHQRGEYSHWRSGRHVLCIHAQSEIPEQCQNPTTAQEAAWKASKE